LTKNRKNIIQLEVKKNASASYLNISKIVIVNLDYNQSFPNGYRDFSHALPDILRDLDKKKCDAVLFSLYSIVSRDSYDPRIDFKHLRNIKAISIEEFKDGRDRNGGRHVIYYKTSSTWQEYEVYQVFGTLNGMPLSDINDFVKFEMPKKILGNCCLLLCGETNGVKYSQKDKKVHDDFGLRAAIPADVKIILNPIHDRMTRFEMKLKRQFLSRKGRWVISVWNKGRRDKNGKVKDGTNPAWTVFYNGKEKYLERIPNNNGVEIGILDINGP